MLRSIAALRQRAGRPAFAVLQSIGVQATVLVVNVATGVVTARLLGPEGRGAFMAATLWPQFLTSLVTAGLGSALVHHVGRALGAEDRGRLVGAALLITTTLTTAAVALSLLAVPVLVASHEARTVVLTQLCLLATYSYALQTVVKYAFLARGAFGLYNLSNLLPPILYLAGLSAAAATVGLTVEGTVAALMGTSLVALLALAPAFARVAGPRLAGAPARARALASYAGRAAAIDAAATISAYADRLVLIPWIPAGELGLYAVALSFSRLVMVIEPAMTSVVFASMSRDRDADAIKALYDYAFRFALHALAAAVLTLVLVDRWVLGLFFGTAFEAAAPLFRILVAEAAVVCLAQLTTQLYLALDRPGLASLAQAGSLALSALGVVLLVPHHGAEGAAWALLAGGLGRLTLLLCGLSLSLHLTLPRPYMRASDLIYLRGRLT